MITLGGSSLLAEKSQFTGKSDFQTSTVALGRGEGCVESFLDVLGFGETTIGPLLDMPSQVGAPRVSRKAILGLARTKEIPCLGGRFCHCLNALSTILSNSAPSGASLFFFFFFFFFSF